MAGKNQRGCLVRNCTGKHYGKGLCARHSGRRRSQGLSVEAFLATDPPVYVSPEESGRKYVKHVGCLVRNCTGKHSANGLCKRHDNRRLKRGLSVEAFLATEPPVYVSPEEVVRKITKHLGCLVRNCTGKHCAKGLCNRHDVRRRLQGLSVEAFLATEPPVYISREEVARKNTKDVRCVVRNCTGKHPANGLCKRHAERRWSQGLSVEVAVDLFDSEAALERLGLELALSRRLHNVAREKESRDVTDPDGGAVAQKLG